MILTHRVDTAYDSGYTTHTVDTDSAVITRKSVWTDEGVMHETTHYYNLSNGDNDLGNYSTIVLASLSEAQRAFVDSRLSENINPYLWEKVKQFDLRLISTTAKIFKIVGQTAEFETLLSTIIGRDLLWMGSQILHSYNLMSSWNKLQPSERRRIINIVRDGKDWGWEHNWDKLLHYDDLNYLVKLSANKGLPEECKMTDRDIRWMLKWLDKHRRRSFFEDNFNVTRFVSTKASLLSKYCRKYARFLEIRQVEGFDITDDYHRRNDNWEQLLPRQSAAGRQSKVDSHIQEVYKDKAIAFEDIGGYTIGVTNDPAIWRKQARTLHQCIVACRYYDKQKSTIIIVLKEGLPHATLEIQDHKIVQAYKDEKADDKEVRTVEQACQEAVMEFVIKHNI